MLGLNLPPYGGGAAIVIALYALQSELRFGTRARSMSAGTSDRGSSIILSLAQMVPLFGFVFAIKGWLPSQLTFPGMPVTAWVGDCVGAVGLVLRLWAVLTLRERYTRTLQTYESQSVERSGPYRFVRHPGYLGSLLSLNGVALASGNVLVLLSSLVVTALAYVYRIKAEDKMLVEALGEAYERYRQTVPALIPLVW